MSATQRQQCWIIWGTDIGDQDAHPGLKDVRDRHHAYIDGLDRDGILVAHGACRDDSGRREGPGMIVFRAATRDEAEKIAFAEPYTLAGLRKLVLLPWQLQFGRAFTSV
jgi:uncharacterized protein YciI